MIKSPKVIENETRKKIESIRTRLDQIKQYKRLIAEEGLTPDVADKALESELIVRLVRLEKTLPESTKRRLVVVAPTAGNGPPPVRATKRGAGRERIKPRPPRD